MEPRQSNYASGCHKNAICQNTVGSYQCECASGYRGDGFYCYDINECDNEITSQSLACHPQAQCHNLPGSYTCECPREWRGDGIIQCLNPEDILCQNSKAVCPYAKDFTSTACLSVYSGIEGQLKSICECRTGYRFTQNSTFSGCVEIDECAEGRHNCNSLTSYCVKRNAWGYNCECRVGYEGSGDGICVGKLLILSNLILLDIDECRRKTADCHPNAYCINKVGSFDCYCAPGYTGNGRKCTGLLKFS